MQIETVLVLISLITLSSGYKEQPNEYEDESVKHIDYEQDQMPVKINGVQKVKRMVFYEQMPDEYERESVNYAMDENNQTPAQDRSWKVRPKVKRMSPKNGKTVHIYLKNEEKAQQRLSKQTKRSTTTTTTTTNNPVSTEEIETHTRKTPELTTKADNIRNIEYTDKKSSDSLPSGSIPSRQTVKPLDSATESSINHQEVIKEKIKIKHHHHHHHHNHVKTVVKKEPFPVEKIVHVPVEKIVEKVVEKKVPFKVRT